MLYFLSDYTEGAHPKVLERLCELNLMSLPGYGEDEVCYAAKDKVRKFCGRDDLQVWFLTGGTQANQVVISTMLRRYEGVISAVTGHVTGHEAGAIEFTGHKVLTIPQHDGKICAHELEAYMQLWHSDESRDHIVAPGMVYISHPTEYGTLYSKKELEDISRVCRRWELPLYMDGARLGYGLMSRSTDVSISDIVELCDVFYIGGTKVGALCGEAVVFTKNNMPRQFVTMTKQQGAMLAKGRLLGMQFDALFTDDLYLEIGRHAIDMAEKLKKLFVEKGYKLHIDSPTNQQFVVIENGKLAELRKDVAVNVWEKADEEHTVVRFVTSWATTEESIEKLAALL